MRNRITALVGPAFGRESQRDAAIEARKAIAQLTAEKAKLSSRVVTLQDKLAAAERTNATQAERLKAALAELDRLSLLGGAQFDEHSAKLGSSLGAFARGLASKRQAKK